MKITVLYIEDNDINTLVVKRMLGQGNIELLNVPTAEEGLELAKNRHLNLILMDIGLPGMDGLTATRQLKADPQLRNIPVIAVTGYEDRKEECFAAGCEDCLIKPITRAKLLIACQRYGVY